MPVKKALKALDEFERACLPFKGFFDYEFGEEKLTEVRKAIGLGAKIDSQFLKALDLLKLETKKLRKAGKQLRKKVK